MALPRPAEIGGLLLVHAHPDDECFGTGGLIANSVAEGRRVDLVTCTGGEEGEIHDPSLDHDEAHPRLREIREAELRCSLDALRGDGPGEIHLHLLGYRDSGMMGTESNERDDVFWHADLDEAAGRVVAIVREARPSVMVTYDANGNYGHPDHINAHRIAVAAWEAAADGSRYPEAGSPHAVAKLYEITFNRDRWTKLTAEMQARGIPLPWDAGDTSSEVSEEERAPTPDEEREFGTPEAEITTIVDVAAFAAAKRAAMDCHKTQRQDMGWLLDLPPDLGELAISPECFVLTRWRDHELPPDYRETSVFDGL
jgi:N-acetyl-1-D-myo-inositol-2-amino-2-deoxy-alpha-D-glucopyranoside deacetylase